MTDTAITAFFTFRSTLAFRVFSSYLRQKSSYLEIAAKRYNINKVKMFYLKEKIKQGGLVTKNTILEAKN